MTKGQQTSLAATYLVAARLVLLGYNAVVTSKNMEGTDILVENPRSGRSVSVQVKGNRSTFTDFLMGKSPISRQRFYVLVNIRTRGRRKGEEYFVLPGAAASRHRKVQRRKRSTWHYIPRSKVEKYREGWGLFWRALGPPGE